MPGSSRVESACTHFVGEAVATSQVLIPGRLHSIGPCMNRGIFGIPFGHLTVFGMIIPFVIMLEGQYWWQVPIIRWSTLGKNHPTRSTMPVARYVHQELLQIILRLSERKVDDRVRNLFTHMAWWGS